MPVVLLSVVLLSVVLLSVRSTARTEYCTTFQVFIFSAVSASPCQCRPYFRAKVFCCNKRGEPQAEEPSSANGGVHTTSVINGARIL